MKILVLTLLCLSCVQVQAKHCMQEHVREAMTLNRERRELYRQDGNKGAAHIMNLLILLEKFMISGSKKLDRSVHELIENDVAMWCEDLVSMDTVPEYISKGTKPQLAFKAWSKNERKALTKQLRRFHFDQRHDMYEKIKEVIENDLNDHQYNCLTRHFLEAMARTLMLADKHWQQAPTNLTLQVEKAVEQMIQQSARALSFATIIDRKASKVQAQGIPVLCQEMPPIPWF